MFAGERGSFDAVMDTPASPLERLQVEETLIRLRVAKVLAAERAIDPHGDEAHLGSQDPGSLFGPESVPSISDKLMDPGRWSRVVVGGFRTTGPIHMLEAWTSHLTLLYAAAEPDSIGKFVVSIGDNMSELLASEAGRASDLALNTIMRKNAAVVFAYDLQWRRRYCESERNPTDQDSRLALGGTIAPGQRFEFDHLDKFLASKQIHPPRLLRFLPPGRGFLYIGENGANLSVALSAVGLRVVADVDRYHTGRNYTLDDSLLSICRY